MLVMPTLVTTTSVLFFSPHSRTNLRLNHSSKAGTKWFHCMMRSTRRAAFALFRKAGATVGTVASAAARISERRRGDVELASCGPGRSVIEASCRGSRYEPPRGGAAPGAMPIPGGIGRSVGW